MPLTNIILPISVHIYYTSIYLQGISTSACKLPFFTLNPKIYRYSDLTVMGYLTIANQTQTVHEHHRQNCPYMVERQSDQ